MDIRMKFGAHKGKLLADVPYDYLSWCLRKITDLDPWLRAAIQAELQRRFQPPPPPPPQTGVDLGQLVRNWYRQMSLAYHPDRGGDTKAMQAVNAGHDLLKKLTGTS